MRLYTRPWSTLDPWPDLRGRCDVALDPLIVYWHVNVVSHEYDNAWLQPLQPERKENRKRAVPKAL